MGNEILGNLPENMKIRLPDNVELMTSQDMIDHILDIGRHDGFNERIPFVCPYSEFDENNPLESEFYLVITDGGKIVSCLTLDSFSPNTLCICGICTDPEYQNTGLARTILKALHRICRDNNLVVNVTGYTEQGQQFIRHIVDDIRKPEQKSCIPSP